jgi:hypothetical protein
MSGQSQIPERLSRNMAYNRFIGQYRAVQEIETLPPDAVNHITLTQSREFYNSFQRLARQLEVLIDSPTDVVSTC